MSDLFMPELDDLDLGYRDIRDTNNGPAPEIRDALENLWRAFQPFADENFRQEFARNMDERFWEMYLTVTLIEMGKNVCATGTEGPDILVCEDDQKIWIEATCPNLGQEDNPDRIIDPMADAGLEELRVFQVPNDPIALRISNSLDSKRGAFERYIQQGVVGRKDIKIVAINGSRIDRYGGHHGFSPAAKTVYPIGSPRVAIDPKTLEVVQNDHEISWEISRDGRDPIPRRAFLHERFADVSGLVWSRRSVGNFRYMPHDLIYVHNAKAEVPLSEKWFPWDEEDVVRLDGDSVQIQRTGPAYEREQER